MHPKKGRPALVALACVSAVLLAACGGGSSSSTKASGTQKSSGAHGVTLNAIFLPATWGTVVKDTLAPEYQKLTGVKVNVQLIARDAIHDKMATLFQAKDSSFDIFNLDYNWIPEFGGAGNLQPMDDVLSSSDKADFFPLAMKVATYNHTLYGIPQTIHPALLWYRKDLYDNPSVQKRFKAETGAELKPPATMDQWKQQAAWFNGKTFGGKKVYGWAAQAAKGFGNVHTWLSFEYTYGGSPFNADFSKSTLSTPQGIKATQQWAAMMKYMPPGANGYTYDNVTTAAQQGTIATAIQWSWGAFAVDDPKSSRTVGKWAFTQVPSAVAGQPSHPHLAEWVIAVSKYSQHAAAAKKFIAWLETKKNDVVQASLGGGDPVRRSSYSNPTLTQAKVPGTSVLRYRRLPQVLIAMKDARPRPFYPGEERWETTLSPSLQAISLGQMSVQQGLKQADQAIDATLAR